MYTQKSIRRVLLAIAVGVSGMTALGMQASAATLFQEDFESYASGSNVNGQGGWTSSSPGFIVQVDPGVGLPTQVANGRHPFFNIQWVFHPLAGLEPNSVSTLAFDGYGFSSPPPSTNSGVGIQTGQGTLITPETMFWDINRDSGGWSFDVRGLSSIAFNRFTIPGHYDEVGHFTIVIDGLANQVFGTADFGAGLVETPHFAITDAEISALNTIVMFQDYQVNVNRLGAEFDNISVTSSAAAVPEPATASLLIIGLAALHRQIRGRK